MNPVSSCVKNTFALKTFTHFKNKYTSWIVGHKVIVLIPLLPTGAAKSNFFKKVPVSCFKKQQY